MIRNGKGAAILVRKWRRRSKVIGSLLFLTLPLLCPCAPFHRFPSFLHFVHSTPYHSPFPI
jgi:hypothetical protein